MTLSKNQQKFLLEMLSTTTVEQAAENTGISRTTAYRYLNNPRVKQAQRELMRGLLSTVTSRLQYEATASVNTLAQIRDDPEAPSYSKVSASKILLEMAYKSFEIDDMQTRIEAIEEFISNEQK